MKPLKLSMLQPWVKARTYILHWDFGFHHHRIVVTRHSFWRVIRDLQKEFSGKNGQPGMSLVIKKFQHGNHYYHYLENYFGELELIGEVIYCKDRFHDLDLEVMFS